jgi:signal transduction histidine kinase
VREVDDMAAQTGFTHMQSTRVAQRERAAIALRPDAAPVPAPVPATVPASADATPEPESAAPAPHAHRVRKSADAAEPSAALRTRQPRPAAAPGTRRRRSRYAGRALAERPVLGWIRRALLDHSLDEGLPVTAQAIANAFAPALVRVWLADPATWAGELHRAGGQELFPALRLGAAASSHRVAGAAGAPSPAAPDRPAGASAQAVTAESDPLAEVVAATRRPLVLLDASADPLGQAWQTAVGYALATLVTLAAYPLLVRGQLLGVLVVGSSLPPARDALAALETVADYCAVAAEHDRLVTYSHSQEALAQTVVRHAPVAVAVLTGPELVFALANPACAQLLGAEGGLRGRRLADVVRDPERLRSAFGLDAVYTTGEPQAMVELPIHLDRGLTYWNVTSSPLPGRTTRVGGVLVAAVDVTHQVMERQRALEAAEVAQERIGQMMALHATSLAVSSQLGADPRELLADILRRSIALLNARAGTVYVADWRVGELEVIVCHGLRRDYVGNRVRIGQGLAGQVARSGQGLLVDDIRVYPASPVIYTGEVVSAVIAVPLVHHGTVVGVLDVLDDADHRTFTQDDLWLLDLFAAQAAQAIENARNYVELERAYRAQRDLDHMKDDFIATASHELRTPLTGVQGFLDLLLDYPGSRDEPLALEFLRKAAESAGELADLAERLLQTSRLDTGRVEMHPAPVHLRRLVDDVLHAQSDRVAIQRSLHSLVADLPEDVWVAADDERLKEVLDNVVGNAIKYSPQGGSVRVSCVLAGSPGGEAPAGALGLQAGSGRTTASEAGSSGAHPAPVSPPMVSSPGRTSLDDPHGVRAAWLADRPTNILPAAQDSGAHARPESPSGQQRVAAGYVAILVSDQGMGIPLEEGERLFTRFSRLTAARSSQIRGTGLGLYICRQLMEAMGGAIWLHESTPGRGSTFALALPLAAPPANG